MNEFDKVDHGCFFAVTIHPKHSGRIFVEPAASLEDLGLLARQFGWRMTEARAVRGARLLTALQA